MKKGINISSGNGTRFYHFCTVGLLLSLGLFLQSCSPTKDANLSNEPAQKEESAQKLLQIELSIDTQGNVSQNENSIGNLSDSGSISDFLLSHLNYDLPDRPKVVLDIEPSTPYSLVKNAILSCVSAKLQSVVFLGSDVTVSLPSVPSQPPEFPPLIIDLEIESSGQLVADGLPMDSSLVEKLPKLTSYFLRQGQVSMHDPNSNVSIRLHPESLVKHQSTINVLNALSTANNALDRMQAGLPKEDRKLLDTVFFKDASPFPVVESETIDIKQKAREKPSSSSSIKNQ